jgi:GNAT superfamily N-acetyltransferase
MLHAVITRRAESADIPAIREMQERSMRELGSPFYGPEQLQAFLEIISTMDDTVVAEGHYFIMLTPRGRVIASGGWLREPPGYAQGETPLVTQGTAIVRSVFVDADLRRHGLGTQMMRLIEDDAAANGVDRLSLTATLSGVPLYVALGYIEMGRRVLGIGEVSFESVLMERRLMPRRARRQVA